MNTKNKGCWISCGDQVIIKEFTSRTDAAKWLIQQGLSRTIKTITKNISAAIESGKEYQGYFWHHKELQPCPVHSDTAAKVINENYRNTEPITIADDDATIDAYLVQLNEQIDAERKEVFENSFGIRTILNHSLPQYKTRYDIMKDIDIEWPTDYNVAANTPNGWLLFHNVIDAMCELNIDLGEKDIVQIWFDKHPLIKISEKHKREFKKIVKKFKG